MHARPSFFVATFVVGCLGAWLIQCSSPSPAERSAPSSEDAGAPSGDAGAPADEWTFGATPAALPASEPGLLSVGPTGLVLEPGDTAQLWAVAYESSGEPRENSAVEWAVTTPAVLRVDADGLVTAIAEGFGEITVSDAHGVRALAMNVSAAPPPGPTGISFNPPVIYVAVGSSQALNYSVTGAGGAVIPGATVSFSASGSCDVGASGVVTGKTVGLCIITASDAASGNPLVGTAYVMVSAPLPSGSGGCTPDPTLVVDGCQLDHPPIAFSRPGLSAALSVTVWRHEKATSNCLPAPFIVTQEAPQRVGIHQPRVVALDGAGLLTSLAPGSTSYTAFVEDEPCGKFIANVQPDMEGEWKLSCNNEDEGQLSIESWPSQIIRSQVHSGAYGGFFGASLLKSKGISCVSNDAEPFECNGEGGALSSAFVSYPSDGGLAAQIGSNGVGLCSEENPCAGPSITECALDRHALQCNDTCFIAQTLSNDHLRHGSCELTRGGDASECGGPSSITVTVDGQETVFARVEGDDILCGSVGNQLLVSDTLTCPDGNDKGGFSLHTVIDGEDPLKVYPLNEDGALSWCECEAAVGASDNCFGTGVGFQTGTVWRGTLEVTRFVSFYDLDATVVATVGEDHLVSTDDPEDTMEYVGVTKQLVATIRCNGI